MYQSICVFSSAMARNTSERISVTNFAERVLPLRNENYDFITHANLIAAWGVVRPLPQEPESSGKVRTATFVKRPPEF